MLRFGLTRFAQSNLDWAEKAQRAEQCRFDVLWTPDHLFHFQRPDEPLLDGWVTLAAWAAITTRIRLGTLITNLSWRSPVLVARAAAAIDQVSGGRFELGLGAGAFADQAMAGVLEMPPGERVARLAEAFHKVRGGVDGVRMCAVASAADHDRRQQPHRTEGGGTVRRHLEHMGRL